MPEEIPWNSSVFPEKASFRIQKKFAQSQPQHGARQGFRVTRAQLPPASDISRQPTRPLPVEQWTIRLYHPIPAPRHGRQPVPAPREVDRSALPLQPRNTGAILPPPAWRVRPATPSQVTRPLRARPLQQMPGSGHIIGAMPIPPVHQGQPPRPISFSQSQHGAGARLPLRHVWNEQTDLVSFVPPRTAWPTRIEPASQPGNISPSPTWNRPATPFFSHESGSALPIQPPIARPIPAVPPALLAFSGPLNQPRTDGWSAGVNQPPQPLSARLPVTPVRVVRAAHPPRTLLVSILILFLSAIAILGVVTVRQQALATAAAANLPYPPYQGTLVLNDPLRSNSADYNWETGSHPTGHCTFSRGSYYVQATSISSLNYCHARPLTLTNFAVQVTITIVTGKRGGLVLRYNQTSGYFFALDRNGFYSLSAFNGSKASELTKGTSPSITPGQTYLLAMVVLNHQVDLYVNQHKITSIKDIASKSGEIALGAQSLSQTTDILFSNIKVWHITQG